MHKLAIYDMDRTITVRPTYSAFLVFMAMRHRPWRLLLIPATVLTGLGYMLKLVDRTRLKEVNQALLLGRIARTAITRSLNIYARRVVASNIRAGAMEQIAADRAAGYRIVMATASHALYAQPIAAALGIEDVIATELYEQDGIVGPQIRGGNCYGTIKLQKIRSWMAGQGLDRKDCLIRSYSDHVSDLPMLDLADVPIASNPHRPLRTLAEERQWAIAQW